MHRCYKIRNSLRFLTADLFLYIVDGAQKESKKSCMENFATHQISY